MRRASFIAVLASHVLAAPPAYVTVAFSAPPKPSLYEQDVEFALTELEKRCGHFFATKGVDWTAVGKELRTAVKAVKSDSDHLGLMMRLIARVRDGHAAVLPGPKGKGIEPPDEFTERLLAPGFHLCRDARTKKVHVKAAWGAAAQAGLEAGMEVTQIDAKPVTEWLDERVAFWRDRRSFSTDAQALAFTTTIGLAHPRGTRLKIAAKPAKGGARTISYTVNTDEDRPPGPVAPPEGSREVSGLLVAKTTSGHGYVRVPKIFDDISARMDQALASLDNPKGLVLDFRGNSGGGCDHDQLLGLFVPKGKSLQRAKADAVPSFGEHPYGGPVVVIVDAMVVSAGETASGMFKEDGRGYLIGENTTAGMSGSKEDVELPSGLFKLHVVTRSNKARFNGGKGIEGVGIIPHEIVPYAADDLAKGKDTLIERALELLAKFPQKDVPYDPAKHEWKAGRP